MKKKNMAGNGQGITQSKINQEDISSIDFAALVPVIPGKIGERETNTASARALHKALGVGRDFINWIKGRIKQYEFVEGIDYVIVENLTSPKRASSKSRQRIEHDYILSLNMAKELGMVERNERGRAIRRYFIECERKLQRIDPKITAKLRQQLKARINAASFFKPMCAALDAARAEQGKTTEQRHYTTESNMLARIVLDGMTAKQWAKVNDIAGNPRDYMNQDQLAHLSYLEQTNITLIELGKDYRSRKAELMRMSARWKAKRLEISTDEQA